MNIPTYDSLLNLNELPGEIHRVYFHEYIHFLQDVTTSDGLANAAMVVNFVRYAVASLKSPTATLPLQVPATAVIAPGQALRQLYLGDGIHLKAQPKVRRIVSAQHLKSGIELPDGRKPRRIEVTFASGEVHHFGANWLNESMAYIAESMAYPGGGVPAEVAYTAAELLAEHLYPTLGAQSQENILALCDASLLFYHPGQAFYMVLRKMRADKWMPKRPEEVYEFARTALKFKFEGVTSATELLQFSGERAIEMLSDYFTSDTFAANAAWVREVILRAEKLRQEQPFFILQLVRDGPIARNPFFTFLLNWLGSPLTTNEDGESSIIPMSGFEAVKDVHQDLFTAIRQVMLLCAIGKSKKACTMRWHCQKTCQEKGIEDYTDDRCDTAPWERSKDDERCAYAVVWHMWGLTGVEPRFAAN